MANDQQEYVWTFPCSLPIKIMGPCSDHLLPLTIQIIQNHVPAFIPENINSVPSKTGKYISLTVTVEFHNKQQIDALYAELAHYQQNTDHISFVI